MAYNLIGMKPAAAATVRELGTRFGIKTIYGFRADTLPEHPSGRAADFMINDLPNGKAVGDALANYVVANAASIRPINVIWNTRIWTAARASEGWRRYTGTSNPHTDHVHVWLEEGGSVGMALSYGGVQQLGFPGQGALEGLEKLLTPLSRKDFWMLCGVFVGGLILVLFAVNKATGVASYIPMGKVAQAAKAVKAVKS